MTGQQIIGLVLLVVGVVLLFLGWQSAEGLDDQVSQAVTGEYTEETLWYSIGGVVAVVVGIALLAFGRRP